MLHRSAIASALVLMTLGFSGTRGLADPRRAPKIYNALISSDENLQPSHAYPLVEPVLRTTALGVAFPPLIVPQSSQVIQMVDPQAQQPADTINGNPNNPSTYPQASVNQSPQLTYHGSLYPLAYDPYVPIQYYQPQLPSQPYYLDLLRRQQAQHFAPQQQQQQPQQQYQLNSLENTAPVQSQQPLQQQSSLPVAPQLSPLVSGGSDSAYGVNFKKNPDIPDVPPPPLPIKARARS